MSFSYYSVIVNYYPRDYRYLSDAFLVLFSQIYLTKMKRLSTAIIKNYPKEQTEIINNSQEERETERENDDTIVASGYESSHYAVLRMAEARQGRAAWFLKIPGAGFSEFRGEEVGNSLVMVAITLAPPRRPRVAARVPFLSRSSASDRVVACS